MPHGAASTGQPGREARWSGCRRRGQPVRLVIDRTERRYRDVLLEPFAANRAQRRRLRAVLGHAVSFWTWRSLCIQHGLSDREAIDAMARLALTTATTPSPAHRAGRSHAAEPGASAQHDNRLTDQA